jgi:hypothetical protein
MMSFIGPRSGLRNIDCDSHSRVQPAAEVELGHYRRGGLGMTVTLTTRYVENKKPSAAGILIGLAITFTSCTHSPTSPSPRQDLTGVWSGSYRITDCRSTIVFPCSTYINQTHAIRLILSDDGNQLRGTFGGELSTGPTNPIPIQSVGGAMDLSGSQTYVTGRWPGCEQQGVELTISISPVGQSGSSLAGSLTQKIEANYGKTVYPTSATFAGQIIALSRVRPDPVDDAPPVPPVSFCQ